MRKLEVQKVAFRTYLRRSHNFHSLHHVQIQLSTLCIVSGGGHTLFKITAILNRTNFSL